MKLRGSCVCGAVAFEVEEPFAAFVYCHCSRCRKKTGSAHAAKVPAAQCSWTLGKDLVRKFDLEGTRWSCAFCPTCGSGLPFVNGAGTMFVVPAGSIESPIGEAPASTFITHRVRRDTRTHLRSRPSTRCPRADSCLPRARRSTQAAPVGGGRRAGAALHALPRLVAERRSACAAPGTRREDAVPRIVGALSLGADAGPHQNLAIDARRRRGIGGGSGRWRWGIRRRGDRRSASRSRRRDRGRCDRRNRRRRGDARRRAAGQRPGDDGRGSAGHGESGRGKGQSKQGDDPTMKQKYLLFTIRGADRCLGE
jgi:hypothetical protein